MKHKCGIFMTVILLSAFAYAADMKPVKPSPKDKCPVCGMFVAKYPDWIAQIIFKDGSSVFFDGAKDMFKYYFNLTKYNPSKKRGDIDSIHVLDYYSLERTDGLNAFFVTGSDVFGPMGRELIPFEKAMDAAEFLKDHKGKSVLTFKEVTLELLKSLD